MAKFKVGDRVISAAGNRGVVDTIFDNEQYAVCFDGSKYPDRIEGWKLRLANACRSVNSTNPVVENALKVINAATADKPVAKNTTITEADARKWLPILRKTKKEIGDAYKVYESAKAKFQEAERAWKESSKKLGDVGRGLKLQDNSNWKEIVLPLIGNYGLTPDDFIMIGAYM